MNVPKTMKVAMYLVGEFESSGFDFNLVKDEDRL